MVCICIYVQLRSLPPTLTLTRLTIGICDVTDGQEFSQQKVYMYMCAYLKERKKKKYDRYTKKMEELN
jgi:hypothetical protein